MAGNIVPWSWRKKRVPVGKDDQTVTSLQRQMNKVFNDFLSGTSFLPEFFSEPLQQLGEAWSSFAPNVNVKRTEAEIVVAAELPGMDEKDIELSLTREALTIRGERKQAGENDDPEGWQYTESLYGAFERIIPLTDEVDEDKVDASFAKGVLTIRLPRKSGGASSTRKVSIKTER